MTTTAKQRREAKADVAALRKAGLRVDVHSGAYNRGRAGLFAPRGWMVHHDATAKGPSPGVIPILINGRSDLSGPLCQWWQDTKGAWHLIAAGCANHGGRGRGRFLARDEANARSMGVETDHTVGEPWSRTQYNSLVRGLAVIAFRRGWSADEVCGHKEYSADGKVDPALSMPSLRKDVAEQLVKFALNRDTRPKYPITKRLRFGVSNRGIYRNGRNNERQKTGVMLIQAKIGVKVDGVFGPSTRKQLRDRYGWSFVGPRRWKKLFKS